jgi:hypothetical protein
MTATFTHKKSNLARFIDTFSLRLTFEDGSVKVERLDEAAPDPDKEPTAKEKMLASWRELKKATCSEVATHATLELKTVWNNVSDLCTAGKLQKTDEKKNKETVYASTPDSRSYTGSGSEDQNPMICRENTKIGIRGLKPLLFRTLTPLWPW